MKNRLKFVLVILVTVSFLVSSFYTPLSVSGITIKSKTFTAGNGSNYYHELKIESFVWIRGQTYYANQSFIIETNPASFINADLRITLRLSDQEFIYSNNTLGGIHPPVISDTTGDPGYYNVSWDLTPDNTWPDIFFVEVSGSFSSPAVDQNPITIATIQVKDQADITSVSTQTQTQTLTKVLTTTETITDKETVISTSISPISTTVGLEMVMVIGTFLILVKIRTKK